MTELRAGVRFGLRAVLRFEPLGAQHVEHLAALVEDSDVLRFTRVLEPPPPGFAENWAARYEAGRAKGTQEGFAVLDGGAFVGLALAPTIDHNAREVELGYIVAPAARGRGVATAILHRLTQWAFEDAGALRSYLIINDDNEPSQRVAARCGYVLEGVMRSVHIKQGLRVDAQLWSRLPSDPPVR